MVALALTAVLALLSAPVRSALRVGCDLCPPDCPMHDAALRDKVAHGHDSEKPKLRCHNTPGAAAREEHGDSDRLPRFAKPACGSHVALTGLDTTPMLPASPPYWRVADRRAAAPAAGAATSGRDRDPPEIPPPVLGA